MSLDVKLTISWLTVRSQKDKNHLWKKIKQQQKTKGLFSHFDSIRNLTRLEFSQKSWKLYLSFKYLEITMDTIRNFRYLMKCSVVH